VTTTHRVLVVDDEQRVLDGLQRSVRGDFVIDTALSPQHALAALCTSARYAVVVSDLRMPTGDGITFLSAVRRASPDSVRMLLTGHGDLDAAIKAVNDGQVFRFLRKPCPAPALIAAITAGIEHYDLVIAERELRENTLQGCIHALADVLALASPLAFARAIRVKECVGAFAARFGVPNQWQFEVAALLSQIGAAGLPKDVAEKVYFGRPLTPDERAMAERGPVTAAAVIGHLPQLGDVCQMLRSQFRDYDAPVTSPDDLAASDVPLGARLLRVANDFDVLLTQGLAPRDAIKAMGERGAVYDPDILQDFLTWQGEEQRANRTREVALDELQIGMTLAMDVVSGQGVLLIARGQRVTPRVLDLIRQYRGDTSVHGRVRVYLGDGPAVAVTPSLAVA
jgi:response regulator RpfG family c-di-GMP phosphodiesterase